MPGTRAGTGQPISFRCWVQRKGAKIHLYPRTSKISYITYPEDHAGVRTGRKRPNQQGNLRMMTTAHEYKCECGHVGWSKHPGVLYLPLAQ